MTLGLPCSVLLRTVTEDARSTLMPLSHVTFPSAASVRITNMTIRSSINTAADRLVRKLRGQSGLCDHLNRQHIRVYGSTLQDSTIKNTAGAGRGRI